jgi:fermentation-respiration switch protein FrsA (DUF1100 family)
VSITVEGDEDDSGNDDGDTQIEGWLIEAVPSDDAGGGSSGTPGRVTTRRRAQATRQPTIVYLHGNGGDRGVGHRVEMYKRLVAEVGARVLAIDYRGFADSPGNPTETSAVADARAAFEWCAERFDAKDVYLWGHSLGGGVATATAAQLECDGIVFGGLVLEATFTSLAAAMRAYPLAWLVYPFPSLLDLVESQLVDRFESIKAIGRLRCKTQIMHGTSDLVVPYSHGTALFAAAQRGRGAVDDDATNDVTFTTFEGCSHINIWTAPQLPETIRKFVGVAEQSSK